MCGKVPTLRKEKEGCWLVQVRGLLAALDHERNNPRRFVSGDSEASLRK